MSIKNRIFVFAILATLIPSLGLGLLSFQQHKTMIDENVTHELRTSAEHVRRELDLWINEHSYTANTLSASNIIINELLTNSQITHNKEYQQALTHYLRSVHEKLGSMLELAVANTEGEIVASNLETPSTEAYTKEWLKDAFSHSIITSPPQWNSDHNTTTISIAAPVLSLDEFVLGALVITLDLKTTQFALKDKGTTPQSEVLLLDSNSGHIILASHAETNNESSLSLKLLDHLQTHPGEPSIFQGIMQQEVIGLAYTSRNLPITIITKKDSEAVYAAWVQQRNLFISLTGILVLIVTAVALRMGHSIVTPLQRLVDATKKIVEGDLDARLKVAKQDELGQLTKMFNEMTNKLKQNQDEIQLANQTMMQKNQLLETLSITDGLTGLFNRGKLSLIIDEQLARYKRNKRPFAILMIDVDYFKHLNDSLGHLAGDEILTAVAAELAKTIRTVDYAARYGGDEFVIILTETNIDQALKIAERIRTQVAKTHCKSIGEIVKVTLSIGIVECESGDTSQTKLLSRVDSALYKAKHAGRDQAYYIKPQSHH